MKGLIGLATVFAAANAGTDMIKDTLYGRPIKRDELLENNLFKLIGINRYLVMKAQSDGPAKAFLDGRVNNSSNDNLHDWLRLINCTVAFNFRLTVTGHDCKTANEPTKSKSATDHELDQINANIEQYVDFSIT